MCVYIEVWGVVSDKVASAKRNPVQTGNTTTTLHPNLQTYFPTYLLTHVLTYLPTTTLIITIMIMRDANT